MGFSFPVIVLAVYCCFPVLCSSSEKKVFVVSDPKYDDDRTLVVITWNEEDVSKCKVLNNDKEIEEISKHNSLQKPTEEEMRIIIQDCEKFSKSKKGVVGKNVNDIYEPFPEKKEGQEKKSPTAIKLSTQSYRIWDIIYPVVTGTSETLKQNMFLKENKSVEGTSTSTQENVKKLSATARKSFTENPAGISMVLPGTKWCGPGDIAKHHDDLGYFEDVDRCCRNHDICDDIIETGKTKYNLTNDSPFTALNCKCDYEFYDCLSEIDTITSNTMGNTYFNVFEKYCYARDYPKRCRTFLNEICIEYETDYSAEMIYQWIPPKKYLKRALPPLPVTLSFLNQGT